MLFFGYRDTLRVNANPFKIFSSILQLGTFIWPKTTLPGPSIMPWPEAEDLNQVSSLSIALHPNPQQIGGS
jgi:hypothetical protein